jgi:hypothetical protein
MVMSEPSSSSYVLFLVVLYQSVRIFVAYIVYLCCRYRVGRPKCPEANQIMCPES